MNAAQTLHTTARRYCLDRFAYWSERYADIAHRKRHVERDGYHYTAEALATFPRYNVLRAIRVELERTDPSVLTDLEETRAFVTNIGRTANDCFTLNPIGPIDRQATAEERELFCEFVTGLSLNDLSEVRSLPFRRFLSDRESNEFWSRLAARWQITEHYWYPLTACTLPDVAAFKSADFDQSGAPEFLRTALKSRGVERVWSICEVGSACVHDISLFEPRYEMTESFWSSDDLSWIVYASHENSVTVGGWALRDLQELWPDWQEQLWTGDFT